MKLTHHNTTPVLHRLLTGALALLWTVSAHAGDAPRSVTLPEATRIALDKNPGLAGAQQRVAAARAALRQADAAFWPQIRLSANYAASDNPVQAFMMTLNQRAFTFAGDFNDPDTTDNLNGKVLATYSLFNGGHDWAGRQAARLGADANAQLLEAARRDLVFEVTRAFHTVGKARRFVRVAETGLASMAENLNVASNRFAQGVALKSDWLDAEVRLAEAREELLRSRNALAIAEAIFRNTLGVGESETMTPAEPGADTPADALTDPAGIAPRPELVAAQKAVAAAMRSPATTLTAATRNISRKAGWPG
jgi:outer membrane protein TolC